MSLLYRFVVVDRCGVLKRNYSRGQSHLYDEKKLIRIGRHHCLWWPTTIRTFRAVRLVWFKQLHSTVIMNYYYYYNVSYGERTAKRPSKKRKGYWPRSYFFFKFTAATDVITKYIIYIGARVYFNIGT